MRVKIARWALPLLQPAPLKGAEGGRSSGKSHRFAEQLIERHQADPNFRSVCLREIQKSIRFSSYQLISDKIRDMGLLNRFDIQREIIKDRLGDGVITFQGMQDHTAASIKSLEGFDVSWFEEAQKASKRSLDLLTPTILRKAGAECWFSWNPEQPEDAIEVLKKDPDFVSVSCTYLDNPFLVGDAKRQIYREAEKLRERDFDAYNHIWLGKYNTKSDAQIFNGKFTVMEFDEKDLGDPLFGLDWGFSKDPTAATESYIKDEVLYIRREAGKVNLELDDTAPYLSARMPLIKKYSTLADCARPESISHVKRKGLPLMRAAAKWSGSVEDGITFMRSFKQIVIHPDCKETSDEFRLYSYKVDKRTDLPTTEIVDKFNHYIDSIRYALSPLIKKQDFIFA